ncbi:hypothetical protein ACFQ6Q_04295 [Streptomyces sp. NPDC056437]|uniref:hypothetical protein n=1 Tax=Streptomyces sp. NPDC056437 TaxID=3345816 RepID=UPI0036B9F152
MAADRLADIQARTNAATDGDWFVNSNQPGIVFNPDGRPLAVFGGSNQDCNDAEFIAHARTDMPWLVGEVREARAQDACHEQQLQYVDQRYGAVHEAVDQWRTGDLDAHQAMTRITELLAVKP